ncbi:MBL fold hydrolase [candidate division SR1 bacterium]|nr:MBL fold hydrolase [candidate division SR1 bacterium]
MGLRISALGSGSTGNCIYIESDSTSLLLDAGLSGKKIQENLQKIGKNIDGIHTLFISHEHIDHIRSAGVLNRKFNTKVCGNQATLNSDYFLITTKRENENDIYYLEPNQTDYFGDIEVTAFKTSHDTANSQFYVFKHQNKRIACLSDTGCVTDEMKEYLRDCEIYFFEANHDVEMLKRGTRPESNKKRILSDVGHLSNECSAEALKQIITRKTHTIVLTHISHDHNRPELAKSVMIEHLKSYNPDCLSYLNLLSADAYEPTPLLEA